MRLADKSVVITGASTGIGFAAAKRLRAEGARLLITGVDTGRLDAAAVELGGEAAGVHSQTLDVRDPESIDGVAARAREVFGGVDVLVANAGVTYVAPFEQVTPDRFDDEVSILLRGTFFTVQRFSPLLGPGASVVLTTSCLGQLGGAGMSVYSAAKAATRSLARSFSAELKDRQVRVNAVAPGPVETPLYSKMGMDEGTMSATAQHITGQVPLGRFGRPEEIAGAIAFLASSDSSYMLGAEITVDGGWTQL